MKYLTLLAVWGVLAGLAYGGFRAVNLLGDQPAAPPAPTKFEPSAEELRTVAVAYQKAVSGETAIQTAADACPAIKKAQTAFNADVQDFQAQVAKVIKAHNWPAATVFNPQTMGFEVPPTTATAPAASAPSQPKK